MRIAHFTRMLLPLGGALALAACDQPAEETTYETDTEDLSGGELQVADPDAEGVPVDLPETEMTNAPAEDAAAAPAEAAPDAVTPAE